MEDIKVEPEKVVESIPNIPANEPSEPGPEISKRQKKKLLKLKQFEERKLKMRRLGKERKKLKRVLAKEQGLDIRSGPSRKQLKRNKIADNPNPADISIAIDLSFDDLMIDKDLSSCASQLLRVYTTNRRAARPVPLHFTGLNNEGKLYKKLEKHEGWKNWDVFPHTESFLELFEKDKIIYLTSESETVLDKLEKDAVYVIGGLVDHNHHKCLTHEIAQKNQIRTARLPLSEYLVMSTRTVLTINQCFDIMIGVSEGKSWKEVLPAVMPPRKNIKVKENLEKKVEEPCFEVRETVESIDGDSSGGSDGDKKVDESCFEVRETVQSMDGDSDGDKVIVYDIEDHTVDDPLEII